MFCTQCGQKILPETKFCSYCGRKKPKSFKLSSISIIMTILVLAFVIPFDAYAYFMPKSDTQNVSKEIINEIEQVPIGTIKNYKFPGSGETSLHKTILSNGNLYDIWITEATQTQIKKDGEVSHYKQGWNLIVTNSNGERVSFRIRGSGGELYIAHLLNKDSTELIYVTHGGSGNVVNDFGIIGLSENKKITKLVEEADLPEKSLQSMTIKIDGFTLLLNHKAVIPGYRDLASRQYYDKIIKLTWNEQRKNFITTQM